jgi:glycosyltransferase involved in cell wall biosynthesis
VTAHVLWTHTTRTGYGRYGSKLAGALRRGGYRFSETLTPDDNPGHLAVWISTPNHARGFFEGQRTVLSTMWETEQLPESFREGLGNFDQILVPSEQNLALFSQYHDNVAKVPLGVDAWDWRYRPRQAPSTRFVFLICGNSNRKGLDLAVAAYTRLFRSFPRKSPRPVLIIKSTEPYDTQGLNDGVQNVTGWLSDYEEQELYASAHCYLQPSRGEGFGLMPLQAIAQGCPTILTAAHGHAEFANLGWPVKAGRSEADYFIHGDGGQWWEPDLDQLCARMDEVYRDYDLAAKEAKVSSDLAHQVFSWERCAERTVEAIGEDHFYTPYAGSGAWKVADIVRYPVIVANFWACEVAGAHYQFHPGRTYYETADVKRILYEANLLDPACVDPGHPDASGLTAAQLERFGDYSASQSYCHHCGQKLGSGEMYQP